MASRASDLGRVTVPPVPCFRSQISPHTPPSHPRQFSLSFFSFSLLMCDFSVVVKRRSDSVSCMVKSYVQIGASSYFTVIFQEGQRKKEIPIERILSCLLHLSHSPYLRRHQQGAELLYQNFICAILAIRGG